eukprot:TRINITY_DN12638_c0_g1_i1.p1 TRINITY_DN12638_c0_g1~~TRINITY_DN12638_c0_g1_i1.p1  ORF type:complete len:898 (+),score=250.52 TRINITY_DN12638_c0_g1_i1:149-2695(+)
MANDGIKTGSITIGLDAFKDSNCTDQAIAVSYDGTWVDLGPNDNPALQGSRIWQLDVDMFTVNVLSPELAKELNDDCPCGGNWTETPNRTLTSCPADSCPDTEFLGGGFDGGIIIGQPFFGWTLIKEAGANVSYFDADIADIKADDTTFVENVTLAQGCDPAVADDNYCSNWAQPCVPREVGVVGSTAQRSFDYSGPEFGGPDGNAGIFLSDNAYYTDTTGCDPGKLYLEVHEEGTFIPLATANGTEGLVVQKVAEFVAVVPHTEAAAAELKTACPCNNADAWIAGQKRILTTCAENSCDDVWWYDNAPVGVPLYATFLKKNRNDDSMAELRMTAWFADQPTAANTAIAMDDYSYLQQQDSCSFGGPFDGQVCGVWQVACGADADGQNDEMINYELIGNIGDGINTGAGIINRIHSIFTPGMGCEESARVLDIVDSGFFADWGNNSLRFKDGRKFVVLAPEVTVTPHVEQQTGLLNNDCACGGKWVTGQPRTLTTCPPNTCENPEWLGGGNLGTPGFGTIALQSNQLRINTLRPTPQFGFSAPMGVYDGPLDANATCGVQTPSQSAGGSWYLMCRPFPNTSFETTGNWTIYKDGSYEWYRVHYATGDVGMGCTGQKAIVVKSTGTLKLGDALSQFEGGYQVQLTTAAFEVTPYTPEAVNILTTNCGCGKKWTAGVTETITEQCSECASTIFLRQNFGPTSYGGLYRTNNFLTVTVLDETEDAYTTPFTQGDLQWILVDGVNPAPAPPPTPIGPSPPPPASKAKKKMDGGGVFLLVVFLMTLSYFLAGMVINYRASGTPAIPHAAFWTSLPGLVSDGCYFSLCRCFGYGGNSGSGSYTNIQSSGGYGAV